jgi:hypothetical protein
MRKCGLTFVAMTFYCAMACAEAAPVEILSPAKEDVIHINSGELMVSVQVDEALTKGRAESGPRVIRILLDGKPAAEGAGPGFTLSGVERGQHTLQAALIDAGGQTLSVSDPVPFTMSPASVNSPTRRKK